MVSALVFRSLNETSHLYDQSRRRTFQSSLRVSFLVIYLALIFFNFNTVQLQWVSMFAITMFRIEKLCIQRFILKHAFYDNSIEKTSALWTYFFFFVYIVSGINHSALDFARSVMMQSFFTYSSSYRDKRLLNKLNFNDHDSKWKLLNLILALI